MASEQDKKKKKRKKARKDKWGQPLPVPAAGMAAEEEDEVERQQEEEEEKEEEEEVSAAVSYEAKKVVVSGMPYSATEEDIHAFFDGVSHLQLSRFPDSGNFRGLAFLTFQTEALVANALKLDGVKMGNRFIRVERCRQDPQRKRKSEFLGEPKKVDGCFSVYIGNLSWDVTEDEIRDFFNASKIDSVRFAFDKNTGTFRGFGHVDFVDDDSLEEAMKKNQGELHGRPIKISYALCSKS